MPTRTVLHILAYSVALAAAFLMGVLAHRKRRQRQIRRALLIQTEQGIVEERFIRIGGIDQWIGIRGEHRNNPVLLVIHGGPGSSYSIFTPFIQSWERHFTVVQWDQRGSGKTFGRNGPGGSGELTIDRLIRDGIEVAEYLRARLRKEKVVLLASSFGTTFGLSMVRRRPELFSAYVGTDQNVGRRRGHEANHASVVARLRALGLKKGAAALERAGADSRHWTAKDFTTTAQWTMKSDPPSCQRIMQLLKTAIWFSPGYSLLDIKHFVAGMEFSIEHLLPEVPGYDAWQKGVAFDVPFFILQGEDDVVTPASLAKEFFDDVAAPVKHFGLISDAGHFAAFVQPEQFLRELLVHVLPVVNEARLLRAW